MGLSSKLRAFSTRSGYLLPLTILAASALFIFATAFLRFVSAQSQAARHLVYSATARQAAMAGRAEAMARLLKDNSWKGDLGWTELKEAKASYKLSFTHHGDAPYCTSNVGSSKAVMGWHNTKVPPGFVHLVAVGRCGSVTQRAEALLSPGGGIILKDGFESGFPLWNTLYGPGPRGTGTMVLGGSAAGTTTVTSAPVVTTTSTVHHPGNSNPQGHAYGHRTTTSTLISGATTATGANASAEQLVVHQNARAENFEAEFRARGENAGGPAAFYFRSREENGDLLEGLRLVLDPKEGQIRLEQFYRGKVNTLQTAAADLSGTVTATGTPGGVTTTTGVTRYDPGNSHPQGNAYGHIHGTTTTTTVTGTSTVTGEPSFSLYKVTVSGGKIVVTRDGVALFNVTDPTNGNSQTRDRFGFGTATNSGMEIDDLLIKSLGAQLTSSWTTAYGGKI